MFTTWEGESKFIKAPSLHLVGRDGRGFKQTKRGRGGGKPICAINSRALHFNTSGQEGAVLGERRERSWAPVSPPAPAAAPRQAARTARTDTGKPASLSTETFLLFYSVAAQGTKKALRY